MQVGVWRIRGIDYISQNAMSHFENTNQRPEREGKGGMKHEEANAQVRSNQSGRLWGLQVWTSTMSSQSLHSTAQHHLNLHSHLVTLFMRVVSYPRPQHITSQPSIPREDLLHTLPAVPSEPATQGHCGNFFSLNIQKGYASLCWDVHWSKHANQLSNILNIHCGCYSEYNSCAMW